MDSLPWKIRIDCLIRRTLVVFIWLTSTAVFLIVSWTEPPPLVDPDYIPPSAWPMVQHHCPMTPMLTPLPPSFPMPMTPGTPGTDLQPILFTRHHSYDNET